MATESFGKFANWPDLQTDYGAAGNGTAPGVGADDTAEVQAWFNSGDFNSWAPDGSYRLTSAITLSDKQYLARVCESPNVRFVWDGAAGGTMFNVNGVAYSRLLECATLAPNGAAIAIDQARLGPSTGNFDTGNQYADITFEVGFEHCIRGGVLGHGFAETSILRCHFNGATKLAVFLCNPNALNAWLHYCTFDDCENDVGNGVASLGLVGYGGWRAYRCIHRNTVVNNYNLTVESSAFGFSARECYSINANRFWEAPAGQAGCHFLLQSNTVLDTKDAISINLGNVGPFKMYDNAVRSRAAVTTGPIMYLGSGIPSAIDGEAVGNRFTVSGALGIAGGSRVYELDNTVVTRASIPDTIPFDIETLPAVSARTVFEVAAGGNVAAAVASAVAVNGIVHLQEGNHAAPDVPEGSNIVVVGDGFMTNVVGLTDLNGPLKFEGHEFRADGNFVTDSIRARNIDQVGSRVFMRGVQARGGVVNTILVNGLDHTRVECEDIGYLGPSPVGLKVVGGPLAAAGTPGNGGVFVYSGLCANISGYAHDFSGGANALVRDTWYEESITAMLYALNITGMVTVTYEASKSYQVSGDFASITDLVGKVSLLNIVASGDTIISGSSSGGKVLGAGYIMMSSFLPTHDYFVNSGGADAKLLNSREWTNDIPGFDTAVTANEGTVTDAFLEEMLAQTRAELPGPIADLPDGVTDIRLYRVWPINGTNSIKLAGQERTGFRLHFG